MSDRQRSILFISYLQLITNGSAGEAVSCGLVQAALKRGFRVTYLGLLPAGYSDSNSIRFIPPVNPDLLTQEQAHYSLRTGNRIESLLYYFDHSVLESVTEPCPALERSYDGVIALDSLAISLAKKVRATVHIGILGDPVGQRLWHSRFFTWKRRFIIGTIAWLIELRYFRRKIDSNWKLGMFGTSYARRGSRILGRPVLDLRPFLSPQGSNVIPQPNNRHPSDPTVVIAFGGTLATTASRLAFQFLNDGLLPQLRATLGKGRFTFKVVGSYMNDYLSLAERFPEVLMTGRVPIFERELEGCDVFVLPMSYPVGVRTRVCAALLAGCYCLCDPSALVNMPELADCATVKTVVDPRDYAQAIACLPMDPESRETRRTLSRAFFEQHYICDVAAKPILDALVS